MMKLIFRWLILGGTLFFLAKALKDHWLEVTAIRIEPAEWAIIAIAIGITLLAHTWAGWVWTWVLRDLNQPVHSPKFIQIYLKTNIAKYLPGNIWHYYGRIMAVKDAGASASTAALSVLLEPLLMVAAALIVVILSSIFVAENTMAMEIAQILGLLVVLCAIHPWFLNRVLSLLQRLKVKKTTSQQPSAPSHIERYPLRPLLGELGFLGLRSAGFIITLFALCPLNFSEIPLLLEAFSLAWLLGVIVPVPAGLGVFEATAIALLNHHYPAAIVISSTGLYRLVSILAETVGATAAWLDGVRNQETEVRTQKSGDGS
ncbi:MAG: YbhN family protein [Rhizonema sp. PD37]|nr:YbhN family protein [Rhizonema sp. PD37]